MLTTCLAITTPGVSIVKNNVLEFVCRLRCSSDVRTKIDVAAGHQEAAVPTARAYKNHERHRTTSLP